VAVALVVFRQVSRSNTAPKAEMQSMAGMSDTAPPPAGASSSAVLISPARQQLIGVRTGVVQRERAEGTTRAVGVLAYDETRVTHIHVRVAGWVERLFIDFVGKPVRRGQALFSVYSPDLVTAQTDYLIALRARSELANASLRDARGTSDALVRAARDRLSRWNVTDAEIAELEARGKASRTVTVFSPFDGVVLERNTFAGQYVTPDMNTFKVGDLSTIWVIGQAFEYEASRVELGALIDVEFPYDQVTRTLSARIDFIYPEIDPQTRRIRFRATLKNPGQKLKPDTYVTVIRHGEGLDRLVVPKEAVIDTGDRQYVLLALENGYFDPRTVTVGAPLGDVYPVNAGLVEGDRVVTSAQFLVDSETNLASAMQSMSMSGMNMGETKPAAASKGSTAAPMPGMPMPTTAARGADSAAPSMPGMPMAPPDGSTGGPREQRAPSAASRVPPPAPRPPPPMPGMSEMPGMNKPVSPKSTSSEHPHSGM
jgi:RND family efflux transporter MFP subunit